MEKVKENRTHKYLSNIFYYLFVILVLGFLGLSFFIEEISLIFDILFISLIISTLVITFYFAVQMLRYNIRVRKKVHLGIFLIVIGFLLILTSLSKYITIGDEFFLGLLGASFFVYWGIGSVAIGFIIELTLLDQFFWDNLVVKPAKAIINVMKSFLLLIGRHWKNILLYTLDLASLGGIIFVLITWEIIWWKLAILAVCVVYPILHHHKIIWRALRFIAVNVFYRVFHKIYSLFKRFFNYSWSLIVSFFSFIKKHWILILFEFLRLLGVAGGVVLIYFGSAFPEFNYFIWIGIPVILISETLTRKSVLVFLKNALIAIGKFVKQLFVFLWNKTKEMINRILNRIAIIFYNLWQFIKRYYVRILLELGRLILAGGGGYLIYYGIVEVSFWYFIYIGISIIILFEIILRKTVLRKLYELLKAIGRFFKNLGIFFWNLLELLYQPFKFIGIKIYELIKFLIRHWVKVILYILDIIAIGSIATTIYFTFSLQFYWWYIVILSASGVYLLIHHARSIWKVIKFVFVDIFFRIIKEIFLLYKRVITAIGMFIKKHWKTFVKELVRLILAAGGILLIVFGDELEPEVIGTILVGSGIVIIPVSVIFSRIVVLKFMWDSIKRFFINLKNLIVGLYHLIINLFKEIGRFIRKYSVWMLRIIGLTAVIYGIVVSFSIGWEALLTILTVSIGGFFLIFAHFIIHPRKFWQFLKSIPKTIKKILDIIWLTLKYSSTYIVSNFLRIILLITMLFAVIYGISLIATFDFLQIIPIDDYIYKLAIGGGLVIVAVGTFVLLRRELKKLRTGQSRNWLRDVKERWNS
ncbi:MAG: hypothetical protein KGD64_06835 [Candidatus Heimdallarchaeota archaeon]|nr:hypothetical protein [Candidatus Heimdallarchaeota archaeon]